ILEIDVDAIRRRGGKLLAPVGALVIDRGIEAEVLDDMAALVRPARYADSATALDLRDLADDGTDGARSGRNDNRLARLRAANLQQAEIGGEARHAASAEHDRQIDRQALRQNAHGAHALIGDAVVLPAGQTAHMIAFLVARGI